MSYCEHHTHRGMIAPGKFIVLQWPKESTLPQLRFIKEIVCMQLDWFIEAAEQEAYDVDAEFASWCRPTVSKDGENERG